MKENTLIIFEKQSQQNIFLKNKHFNHLISGTENTFILTKTLTDYHFSYPEKIYREYPYLSTPIYHNGKNSYATHFQKKYTNLIVATDPDTTGYYGVHKILFNELGNDWESHFDEIKILNTCRFPQEEEKVEFLEYSFFKDLIKRACIKYHFDYNYNLNSQVFFKEIFKKLRIKSENLTITKYMILLLWDIKKNQPRSDAEILKYMRTYRGSGKYEACKMGSEPSFYQIFENLISLKLIERKDRGVAVSDIGEIFLDKLVKQTYDPDLPMRLRELSKLSLKEGVSKVDKYISSIFLKQKNKNKGL